MFPSHDLGASVYKTWSDEQRRDEIGRLVQGYRAGLPVGVLCKMAETIAGSQEIAKAHLSEFLTPEERKRAVEVETGGMRQLVSEFML